jgi:hypothetical protein
MTDYEALKRYGHSPAKAAEIVLDAKRGDPHALAWLTVVRPAGGAPCTSPTAP